MKRFPGRVDGVAVHPFASSLHLAAFQFPRETLAGPRKFTQINCTVIMQDDSSQLENCNCHNSCPSILAQIFALIIVTKVQVCVHLHFHCWQFIGGKPEKEEKRVEMADLGLGNKNIRFELRLDGSQ